MTLVEILEFLRECFVIDVAAILGVLFSIVNLIVSGKQKKKLQKDHHEHEEKILHLTKLYENLPYFAEQKEKKINTITIYKDTVSDIFIGKYEIDKFNSIADDVLTCMDEILNAELISEIEVLNEKIREYFEHIRRNDSWAKVTLGKAEDLFKVLKPKLLALIRDQKSTIEHAPEALYAAHGGEKVEKSNMSDEKIKKLKKKVKYHTKK